MAARLQWRQAATLILARNGEGLSKEIRGGKEKQLKILYIKRSTKSSDIFSSQFTFPGGTLDAADRSNKWWKIYERLAEKFGLGSAQECLATCRFDKNLRLYSEAGKLENGIPVHVAFRICAIRETFEETGLLLCLGLDNLKREDYSNLSERGSHHFCVPELQDWRELVHKDASNFINLCSQHNCVPNVWSLVEWSNWLTPHFLPKRWDTVFYITTMAESYSPSADKTEVSTVEWLNPLETLQKACKEEISLPVPTMYESNRLNRFSSVDMLARFSRWRAEHYSCFRVSPIIRGSKISTFISTFPKDYVYENRKDEQADTRIDPDLSDATLNTGFVNRLIKLSPNGYIIVCNAVPIDGHLIPSLLSPDRIKSKL